MAETLTYDAGTDTVSTAENLTPEEQESLKVGEEMEAQQEQLLAGKYKNAEDLEQAYIELQKKLGEEKSEDTKTTTTEETKAEETTEEEALYLEDGSVDYEKVNDAYGSQLGEIFKNSDVDPWKISEHFHANEGTITDEMYTQLEDAGLSRASIDSYLAGRAAQEGYTNTPESEDLTDAQADEIKTSLGGAQEYGKVIQWAGQNLPRNQIEAFDSIVANGNVESIKLAAAGLKAQYEAANGYEGKLLTGKAPKASRDVFRSQAEVVAAMGDPRYERDPAYRQDLMDKLERSDVQF